MKKFFVGFVIAWNMLTSIPIFKIYDFKEGYSGWACASYGLVGFILGSIIYSINFLLNGLEPSILEKILIFSFYTLLYGALHLDGLFDSLDAIFLKAPKEKVIKVLKDPHLGAFSVIFGSLFLIVKLTAFIYLKNLAFFILATMISRYSVIFAMKFFPYISNGMALKATQELKKIHIIFSSLIVIILGTVIWKYAVLLIIISIASTFAISKLLKNKFCGLNGDMYGFIIEINELLLLLIVVLHYG